MEIKKVEVFVSGQVVGTLVINSDKESFLSYRVAGEYGEVDKEDYPIDLRQIHSEALQYTDFYGLTLIVQHD